MKSKEQKSISNLENQKVDSEKIQGGGVGPIPSSLTKESMSTLEVPENNVTRFGAPTTKPSLTSNKIKKAAFKGN